MTYPPDPANSGYIPHHNPYPPAEQPFQLGQMAPQRRGLSTGAILAIVAGVMAFLCIAASVAVVLVPSPSDKPSVAADTDGAGSPAPYDALPGQPAASSTPSAAPPTTTTPAAPAGPKTSFGDGTWEVGAGPGQITPGKYRTTVPADSWNCYWERLKGTSGSFDDIIANDNVDPGTPTVVTIAATDAAFKARGCGTWQKA